MSLDVNYYSFRPERADEKWENFIEDTKVLRLKHNEHKELLLNDRQAELDEKVDMSYLAYEDSYNHDQLISNLKFIDLYYGSIMNEYFEDPDTENFTLNSIVKSAGLELVAFPTREEMIQMFANFGPEIVKKAAEKLVEEFQWTQTEAEEGINLFHDSIEPVITDLKEYSDAIPIRLYGGEINVEPDSANQLLTDRAIKHADQFKGKLPPIL